MGGNTDIISLLQKKAKETCEWDAHYTQLRSKKPLMSAHNIISYFKKYLNDGDVYLFINAFKGLWV